MSSELAISIENVSKSYTIFERPEDRLKQILWRGRRKFYRDFWALQDISFEVAKGETVGIVGRNGAGKSTLLQIICGTLTPTTGQVFRRGRLSALLELGSGFNPEFTGRENVYLGASILGLNREEIDARFPLIQAFADIGDFIDSPVKHLSSGMFARLAFSVAIHVEPEILIVDEILAVGDLAFQRRCLSKFYQIRDGGCTILFVSHDQYQVKSICQRALYLDRGQQKIFGPAGKVIDQYVVDMEASEAVVKTPTTTPTVDSLEKTPNPGANDERASAPDERPPSETPSYSNSEIFRITSVELLDASDAPINEVSTGQTIKLRTYFKAISSEIPRKISFVFNLYRHDDLYLCGTTTLMDGMQPHDAGRSGVFTVTFKDFPVLGGRYKWRVAINDDGGFITLAEAKGVCPISVTDGFDAVGLFNLKRTWDVQVSA